MAEFVTVMKEARRYWATGIIGVSFSMMEREPEKAEKIIMDWAAEHPAATLKSKFFEMFPDAPKHESGTPITCARALGWANECSKGADACVKCWNRPYEERRNE